MRPLSLAVPLLVAALLLQAPVLLAAPAEGSVPDEVAGLHYVLVERIAEIGDPPPSKLLKKESKSLAKAVKELGLYVGVDDRKDLVHLARCATALDKSKTADAAVLAQAVELRDHLSQYGLTLRQDALGSIELLDDAKVGVKVEKTVAKADALRDKGLAKWPDAFGKGAKLLAKAANTYRSALGKGIKKQFQEAKKVPNDARPTGLTVLTQDVQIHHRIKVLVETELAQPAKELSIALRAFDADDLDAGLPDSEVTDAKLGVLTLRDVPAGTRQDELDFRIPIMRNETVVKQQGDDYGYAMGVSGDTAVSGSLHGEKAFVFEQDEGGPGAWGRAATLVAPQATETFGWEVAIDGDTLVVCAPRDDTAGTNVGAAFVFERDEGGPGVWGHVKTLYPDDASGEANFGVSAAVDGDTIVIGAHHEDIGEANEAGAAYVFRRNAGGPGNWGLAARLERPGAKDDYDRFGAGVDVDGEFVVVGAPGVDGQTGEAHVFGKDVGGTNAWGHVQTLVSTTPSIETFGQNVAISGSTIAISAYDATVAGHEIAGKVYVFEVEGDAWFVVQELDAGPDLGTAHLFGYWMALDGDLLVAGGLGPDGADGAAIFSRYEVGGFPSWGWLMNLEDADGNVLEGGSSQSGGFAAMDGDTIVIGNSQSQLVHFLTGMERIAPGDWYLGVEVDPRNRLIETLAEDSEDNNLLVDDDRTTFGGDKINAPNVTLASVELTPGKIFVDTDGTPAVTLTMNAKVTMTGKHDGPLFGADLLFGGLANVGGAGLVALGGRFVTPSTGALAEAFPLPPLVVNTPLDIDADIALALPPGVSMLDEGNYLATLVFQVETTQEQYEPDGPDDTVTLASVPYNVIEIQDCSFSQTFVRSLGNGDVRGTVDLAAHLDVVGDTGEAAGFGLFVGSEAEAGVVASVQGTATVDFFGLSADILEARAVLERDPILDYGFLAADLVFENPISGKSFVLYAFGPYDSDDLAQAEQKGKLPPDVSVCDGGLCYSKTFDVEKSYEKQKTFLVEGIPVTVKGAVGGKLGLEFTAVANDELSLEAKPMVDFSASASAEIGVCSFDLADYDPTGLADKFGLSFSGGGCVGAEGQITLLSDEFDAKAGVGMTVVEGIDALDEQAVSLDTALCFRATNSLELLDGKLTAFAVWTEPKWCKAGFIPYPCGSRARKAEREIVSFHPYSFDATLLDATLPICCVPVVGLPICGDEGESICALP